MIITHLISSGTEKATAAKGKSSTFIKYKHSAHITDTAAAKADAEKAAAKKVTEKSSATEKATKKSKSSGLDVVTGGKASGKALPAETVSHDVLFRRIINNLTLISFLLIPLLFLD